jgi:50S ribosomal subunit-associated GTPase HflX
VLEGLLDDPRPPTLVFNKCDLMSEDELAGRRATHGGACFVSARRGMGLAELRDAVWREADARRNGGAATPSHERSLS